MAKAAKQALTEFSGAAGGYTVPVDQATGDVQVADREAICQECGGSGECTGCGGAGEIEGRPCELCGGSGECVGCAGTGMKEKSVEKTKGPPEPWKVIGTNPATNGQYVLAADGNVWYYNSSGYGGAWSNRGPHSEFDPTKYRFKPKSLQQQPHNRIKNYVR